eukprot:12934461-Prorocentrum_lima.AAC.1
MPGHAHGLPNAACFAPGRQPDPGLAERDPMGRRSSRTLLMSGPKRTRPSMSGASDSAATNAMRR